MIRRAATILTTAGLALGGVTAAAPNATAAGACSLHVQSKVSIGTPFRSVPLKAGSNCSSARIEWATWDAVHPTYGYHDFADFDATTTTDSWDMYSWNTPPGKYSWRPTGAYDVNYDDVFQYGPYTVDVRMGSYARISASRSGSKVTLRTTAKRYWGNGEQFIGWSAGRGQIQYRTPGSSTWKALKEVYSSSSGTYSYSYTTSSARYYRVVMREASTIWGSTSPQVHRS